MFALAVVSEVAVTLAGAMLVMNVEIGAAAAAAVVPVVEKIVRG